MRRDENSGNACFHFGGACDPRSVVGKAIFVIMMIGLRHVSIAVLLFIVFVERRMPKSQSYAMDGWINGYGHMMGWVVCRSVHDC